MGVGQTLSLGLLCLWPVREDLETALESGFLMTGVGSRLRNLNKNGSKDPLEVWSGKKADRSYSEVLVAVEMGQGHKAHLE